MAPIFSRRRRPLLTPETLKPPREGEAIRIADGRLQVPATPILPFIEGDGTGPDIWRASQRIFDAAVQKAYGGTRRIVWFEVYAGEKAHKEFGSWLPEDTLRPLLDLYACVRPVRWFENVPSPVKYPERLNVVIFRENTEDIYAGLEHPSGSAEAQRLIDFVREAFGWKVRADAGVGLKPMSPFGSKRLVRKAINHAIQKNRKSVTLVHKGNIMKFTEGAFREWGYQVAREEFADKTITWDQCEREHGGKLPPGKILIQDTIADVTFQHLLIRPENFDIIATGNLNGDSLSDAAAAQVGGIGMAPGANISDFHAVFEATHGTAPKYANQDKVNPGSLTLSGVMLLEYLGWPEAAGLITRGLERTFLQKIMTYDLARLTDGAREVRTSEFATAGIGD